ncbi:MAG: nitrous oxide reductase family maturation protein NosD [Thermodesulfovibrionales bacterium]
MEEVMTEISEFSLWRQVWEMNVSSIIIFSLFLISILLIMVFRGRLSKNRKAVKILRNTFLVISFVYVGLFLKAQPTTTNIVIILNSLKEMQFPLGLFLLEPFIFISFIFIAITIVFWGRGVFCGWLCPYGAFLELLNKVYDRFFPGLRIRISGKVNTRMVYLKYIFFLIIAAVSFYSFMLSEYLTEIEPFRTFVLKLKRDWFFVAYFMVITIGSVLIYRAFCRYLCPLGAALAIPSFIRRIPILRIARYDFCGTCKICGRTCRPQAIADGTIDMKECLECLDCQLNYCDQELCPVLIRQKKKGKEMPLKAHAAGLVLLVLLIPSILYGKTLYVGPEGYKSISEAIRVAKDGDTIEVRGGEYSEEITINKSIYLKGINNPVIKVERGNIITVLKKDVTVEGFTLIHGRDVPGTQSTGIYVGKGADSVTVRNNHLKDIMFGIWAVSNRGIRIEGNVVDGRKELDLNYRGNCIYLTDAQEATVSGNRLNYCRDGMYVEVSHDGKIINNEIRNSRYALHTMWVDRGVFNNNHAQENLVGLAIMYTKQSEMNNNISVGNKTHGLLLIQTVRGEIKDNIVIGNTKGIFLYNSILNKLTGNLIMNNNLGLHSWGGSEENEVTKNSFINNEIQVKFVASRDQQWDNNYWSDYLGWDMTEDGIGDIAYESNTVVDHILWRYPMAKILYSSPALQVLWVIEKQFPFLKVPRVVDRRPSMFPFHAQWKEMKERFPYSPVRYYGDIDKLPMH